jgi:hypothetical protein
VVTSRRNHESARLTGLGQRVYGGDRKDRNRIGGLTVKLGIAAAMGTLALVVAPSAALACTAKRAPHGAKKCSAESRLGGASGCPTATGQSVIDWTDFNIPKGATGIRGDATVNPRCQNSTQTTTLNVGAKTDPDGSATHPPPGDKIAQVVVTETGTGPSTHNDALVTYGVTWTDAKALRIHKRVRGKLVGKRKQHGHTIDELSLTDPVEFTIEITNFNFDSVLANLTDHLPKDFKVTRARPSTGQCEEVGRDLRCSGIVVPAPGTSYVYVTGSFTRAGQFINRASATGRTRRGAVLPNSNEAEVIFDVVKPK